MADSIAKLAVILTGDGAPLSAALQASLRDVDKWQLGMARAAQQAAASWNAGLAKISSANMQAQLAGPGGPMAAFDPSRMIPSSVRGGQTQIAELKRTFEPLVSKAREFTTAAQMWERPALRMGMALSAARGNMAALVNLGLSGGPVTAIVAATVAAGALAFKLAAISDAQKVATGSIDTWAHQFDRVQENANRIAVTLGRPISNSMARETGQIADVLGVISRMIMPDWQRQEEQVLRIMQAQTAAVQAIGDLKERTVNLTKGEAEAFAQAAKTSAELLAKQKAQGHGLTKSDADRFHAAQKVMKDLSLIGAQRGFDKGAEQIAGERFREMESRAESLKNSLMTAREQFVASLADAGAMFEAGLLSAENYKRAASEAAKKFQEADKVRSRGIQAASQGVGAAERSTMAGFSAVQHGQREIEKLSEISRQQLKAERDQVNKQEETNEILRQIKTSGGAPLVRSSISG